MKMKQKIIAVALLVLMVCSLFAGCSNNNNENKNNGNHQKTQQTELLISAAASMTDVLEEIKRNYTAKHPEIKLTYTFGGSGALQTQIEEGAPVDIFMSAAQKQMTALEGKDKIISDTKKTLLVNKVVLIAPADSAADIKSFDSLTTGTAVTKIALGDPASVPVGQYSEEIFTHLNNLDAIKKKAVYGSDVRTVLTWVESGEVDCGIVYATDAASSDKIKIICEAPEGSHTLVTYPVAVVQGSQHVDQAKAFLDYLSTDEAKTVFEKYGFAMN